MKLHEYNEQMEILLNAMTIDEETGEVKSETIDEETGEIISIFDKIGQLDIAFEEKAVAMGCYAKDLDVDIAAYDAEIKRMQAAKKSLEKKKTGIVDYLDSSLRNANKKGFKNPKVNIGYRKSSGVVIAEGAVVPEQYIKRKIEEKPDKTALKAAINAGEKFDGISIEERMNIYIK